MKTTRAHVGTGITRRMVETHHAETVEDMIAIFDSLTSPSEHPFQVFLGELGRDASAELAKRELPCTPGGWWKKNGKWISAAVERLPIRTNGRRYVQAVLEEHEPDSVAGYSVRLLEKVTALTRAVDKGEATAGALQAAYELGALHQEAKFKLRFEKAVLTGAPVRAGARRGGRRKSSTTTARDVAMARLYLEQRPHPRLSDTALKAQIGKAQKRSLERSAAVAAIDRGLEILSGETGKPDS